MNFSALLNPEGEHEHQCAPAESTDEHAADAPTFAPAFPPDESTRDDQSSFGEPHYFENDPLYDHLSLADDPLSLAAFLDDPDDSQAPFLVDPSRESSVLVDATEDEDVPGEVEGEVYEEPPSPPAAPTPARPPLPPAAHSFSHLLSTSPHPTSLLSLIPSPTFHTRSLSPAGSTTSSLQIVPDSDASSSVLVPDSDEEEATREGPRVVPVKQEESDDALPGQWPGSVGERVVSSVDSERDDETMEVDPLKREGSPELGADRQLSVELGVAMDVDEDAEVDIMGMCDDSAHDAEDEDDQPRPPLKFHPLTKHAKHPSSKKASKPRARSNLSAHPSPNPSTSHSPPSTRNSPDPVPVAFPFAFPVPTSLPIPTVIPSTVGMSKPFANYQPPSGPGGRRNDDSEDEAGGRGFGARRGNKGKGRKGPQEVEEEELEAEETDDRLYCICQSLYDPDRTMIACDKCENWYHLDCIKIADENLDLVDQLICPLCEKLSSLRTTWHAACARPDCLRAVMPLSKYCSDYCGISVAAARLALCSLPPEAFWPAVVGARRRESGVIDHSLPSAPDPEELARRGEREDETVRRELEGKLESVVSRRIVLDRNRDMVGKRLAYLAIAIRRWEALCQVVMEELKREFGEETQAIKPKGKKGKKGGPVSATSAPDAPCGFDVKLVIDDREWEAWIEGEEGRGLLDDEEKGLEVHDQVCTLPRKKCERHTGWQKVRQADFEVEHMVLTRRLASLDVQDRRLRARLDDHKEASEFRALHRNRVGNPISVEGKMGSSPAKATPPKRARALGGTVAGGGGGGGGGAVGGENADGREAYEVPDEVFAMLSRREQNMLKGARK